MIRLKEHLPIKLVRETDDDSFDWDQEGDIDTSMDSVHTKLAAVQKEMDMLFQRFKRGQIGKEDYITDRKALQAERDSLESAVFGDTEI